MLSLSIILIQPSLNKATSQMIKKIKPLPAERSRSLIKIEAVPERSRRASLYAHPNEVPELIRTTFPERIQRTFPERIRRTFPELIRTTFPERIQRTFPERIRRTFPERSRRTVPEAEGN